ncbi:unknown protein [Oryza sativa Japonica Group]|uniref:Uncharacterized protein n=1 Tax=Oryza sativa subsp. japonica TaxID=39947 RepID=Q5ZAT5_ORYSJ|nr:unknown protein [Oryza sativa Japonica Group]
MFLFAGFKISTYVAYNEKKKGASVSSPTSLEIHIQDIDQEAMEENNKIKNIHYISWKNKSRTSSHMRPYINNNKLATLHTRPSLHSQPHASYDDSHARIAATTRGRWRGHSVAHPRRRWFIRGCGGQGGCTVIGGKARRTGGDGSDVLARQSSPQRPSQVPVMTKQPGLNTEEYPPQENNLGLYTRAEEYPY